MTTEQLRRFQAVRPFHPYAVHLADGRHLTIRHPELVNLSQAGRTASGMGRDGLSEVIDLLRVVSLRPVTDQEISAKRGE